MEGPDWQLELSLDVTSCCQPTEPAQESSVVLAQHRLADQETRTKQNAQMQPPNFWQDTKYVPWRKPASLTNESIKLYPYL